MKTSKIKSFVFGMAFFGAMAFTGTSVNAQEVEPVEGGGFDCKIELIRCNFWNANTRQVCHQNGDGLDCICGQSTTC